LSDRSIAAAAFRRARKRTTLLLTG